MPIHEIDGAKLFVHEAGASGPPIVFIHGALCQHDDWRHQTGFFANGYRVFAPDLRGHGRSREQPGPISVERFAADVLAMLSAAGTNEPAVLVGHSMGCRVLLQIWANAPDRVAALVFVDGAYLVTEPLGALDEAARARRASLAREQAQALFLGSGKGRRASFGNMFFDERFASERDRMQAHADSLPASVARELMPGFAAWDVMNLERILGTVTAPTLVFASTCMDGSRTRRPLRESDTTAWLRALATHAPAADVYRHYDAGHFLMIEQPELVNRRIGGFLARHGLANTCHSG